MTIPDITETLRIYCAMWPERAYALLAVRKGQQVHPATMAAFRSNGLTDFSDQLTAFGQEIAERAYLILLDRFDIPCSEIKGIIKVQLEQLDTRRVCRFDACKAHGLKAGHLKALRSIVLYPGQAFNTLDQVFDYDTLRDLDRGKFITCGEWRKYDQVWPTAKAQAFLLSLAGAEFVAHVAHVGQPA